jgi:hypothetical protein
MESIMGRCAQRSCLCLALIVFCATLVCAQTNDNNAPLTNAAVLKLVRAGFKEKTIISLIDVRPPAFDLSTDSMIELKRTGVSEHIILAMVNRQQGLSAFDDNWGDDAFFQNKSSKPDNRKSGNQNQADIFGSSGGVQSNTKTRGNGNLEQSGETQTTGSATVRIIRPQTESGGAPLKLEKTASLTNDSIIQLVEAGFSEGTIVRRIEQSPVEFDLSEAKIAELKKHLVGQRIITAMRLAMGDEANKPAPSNGASKPK